jgi:hypothetical protein
MKVIIKYYNLIKSMDIIIQNINDNGEYKTYSLSKDFNKKLIDMGYVVEKLTVTQIQNRILITESYWRVFKSKIHRNEHVQYVTNPSTDD